MKSPFKLTSNYLFWVLCAGLLMFGCKNFVQDDRISEGIIVYKVSYPKLNEGSVLKDFLPNKMTLKFNDNKFHSELSAAFGLFKTNIINFGDAEHYAQTVKLIDKKFAVEFDTDMVEKNIQKLPPITLEFTEKTKKIAGYTCKEVIIRVDNEEKEVYNVYYTEEINIEESNWFNQYNQIPGVLMEYQIERYNIRTRFTAETVESVDVDKDLFKIEEDYEIISQERLDSEMMDIFNEFSDE